MQTKFKTSNDIQKHRQKKMIEKLWMTKNQRKYWEIKTKSLIILVLLLNVLEVLFKCQKQF